MRRELDRRTRVRSGRWPGLWLLALYAALAAVPARGASVEVSLQVPVRARLDLRGRDSVAVSPFLVVSREGRGSQERSVDVQREFHRYLVKTLKRQTDLKVADVEAVDYPSYDLELLSRNRDFWRALGERTGTDLILTGSIDFDVQDRSGYRTEEYVSPFDGRTYYRQVLVEQTGFEYDIVLQVFDSQTGELLYSDNFKDFRSLEGESTDPLTGMFQNLYALEDRIVGVFAQKKVETTRVLFTN